MKDINLKNKYKNQRFNTYQPNATCNVTALANGLSCLGMAVDPDELYKRANSKGYITWSKKLGAWVGQYVKRKKLNQVWAVLEKLADDYLGSKDGGTFKDNWLTIADMIACIEAGHPVIVGGKFTHGGHIICITGRNAKGFIVDDSWGNWMTGYKNHNGNDCLYPYDKMRNVLTGKKGRYRALVLKPKS